MASPNPLLHYACAGTAWLVLHPMRVPPVLTPAARGLRYRSLKLRSGDVDLAAWHIPCEGSRRGLVLCHGHNDSRLCMLPVLRPLHEAGFQLFLFDHRTMGVSGGNHCTYGYEEQHDVTAAADWLRAEAAVESVGLMGVSMGGASVLLAGEAARADAVVSDCAFARLEEMVEQKFFYLPKPLRQPMGDSVRHWTTRWCGDIIGEVDPERAVRSWRDRPLLVIHGERDLLIPVEHGRRISTAAGGPTELWTVPGAHHARSLTHARDEYLRRVTAFFDQHVRA